MSDAIRCGSSSVCGQPSVHVLTFWLPRFHPGLDIQALLSGLGPSPLGAPLFAVGEGVVVVGDVVGQGDCQGASEGAVGRAKTEPEA